MTILKCYATKCLYNEDNLCSKGQIDVAGENAHISEETSCSSFRDRSSSASNTCKSGCGCETIQIDCKAHNCTYNDQCKCTAASINVDGSGAGTSQETSCGTFECK
jgi:hypothetical protein